MYIHCHYRVQFGRELEVSGCSSRVEQDIASFLVKKLIILICSEMTLILLYIWCHRGVDIMQVKDD